MIQVTELQLGFLSLFLGPSVTSVYSINIVIGGNVNYVVQINNLDDIVNVYLGLDK
jgi:hypothetical protein